jgi:hypothetical protein
MIRNPWVVSRKKSQVDVEHYYFSLVRDLFEFVALEVFAYDEKTSIGYLVLSISRKRNRMTIKILDYYFHNPKDIFIVGYIAIKYTKDYGAVRLEYPVGLATFFENQPGLLRMIKKKKRLYLFSPQSDNSPLKTLGEKIKLNYCDGDTAFT